MELGGSERSYSDYLAQVLPAAGQAGFRDTTQAHGGTGRVQTGETPSRVSIHGDRLGTEDGSNGKAHRYNEGKVDYSIIPLHLLEEEARVWMHGEAKYGRWNWTKGLKWSGVMASCLRHLFAWLRGEDIDSESGYTHIAHAMCNLRMLQLYRTEHPELDDRRKA